MLEWCSQSLIQCAANSILYFEINTGLFNPNFISTALLNSVQLYTKTASDDAFYGELKTGLQVTPSL
jgi:hypothetical protein